MHGKTGDFENLVSRESETIKADVGNIMELQLLEAVIEKKKEEKNKEMEGNKEDTQDNKD